MSKIAVAVVSLNTREVLEHCLQSLPVGEASRVLVMDNGSTDGSVEMVASRFPLAEVYSDPSNPGYGVAANHAMELTSEPYLLLLNSDTILAPGAIRGLEEHLDAHRDVAVVGPRLLNLDGSLQPSQFLFPHPILTPLSMTGLDRPVRWMPGFRARSRSPSHERVRSVPWIRGAVLALRRSAFESLGGFREDYFMYWEETDYCRRAHLAGWDVHFTPAVEIVHVGEASTDRVEREMRLQLFRNLVLYHRLTGSRVQARLANLALRAAAAVKVVTASVRLLATSDESARARLRGERDLWRDLMGGGWTDRIPAGGEMHGARSPAGRDARRSSEAEGNA